MFKHHKYCVIEASGFLVAVIDPGGAPNVNVLDGAEGAAVRAAGSGDATMDALSLTSDKNTRVRITDPALIEFVCRLSRRCGADGGSSGWPAQIAGTVDMDGGEAQFSYVSQAFIYAKDGLLTYEPNN